MTAKTLYLYLLPLIFLLTGCGKSDDISIERCDWTLAQAISASGERIETSSLSCAAQDGILTVTAEDSSIYTGTYVFSEQSSGSLLYEITLDGTGGIAVVGQTTFEDGTQEETLILSFADFTLYFRAGIAK